MTAEQLRQLRSASRVKCTHFLAAWTLAQPWADLAEVLLHEVLSPPEGLVAPVVAAHLHAIHVAPRAMIPLD